MNKVAVTQAQLKRAFAVAADLGQPVAGIKVNPDGSAELLFGEPLTKAAPSAPQSLEEDPWEAYRKRHGYG